MIQLCYADPLYTVRNYADSKNKYYVQENHISVMSYVNPYPMGIR